MHGSVSSLRLFTPDSVIPAEAGIHARLHLSRLLGSVIPAQAGIHARLHLSRLLGSVIPAEAGIHRLSRGQDSCLRGSIRFRDSLKIAIS
jgi:hypothetical protein